MGTSEAPYYEYIVVGCGGVGSAALYWLSTKAGKNVLGLEQFELGHERGGSQDHSRIIRLMYHEEKFAKLALHTFDAWAKAEEESGVQLVYKCGSLDLASRGTSGEKTFRDYCKTLDNLNIKYEHLDSQQLRQRFPQFRGPRADGLVALYQKEGGLVDAAMGNAVHVQLARGHGATVYENTAVTRIDTQPDGTAVVHTTRGPFRCRRVVITAGAWSNNLLGSVGVNIPLVVSQEQVTYYKTTSVKEYTKAKFPVWIYQSEDNDYYGLPIHGNSCSKIGIDAGGFPVTADSRTFTPDPRREERCQKFLENFMPSYLGPISYTKTCLYTMPYDRSFVIDTLKARGKPQVIFCIAAGHGYKFAALFGQILSELAVDGRTDFPISPFTMDREAISNPNYVPIYKNILSTPPPPETPQARL